MDPLSDVLSLLRPRSHASRGFDAGGRWSVQFPQYDGIKCYAVAAGECWLVVEGVADPVRLTTGDCFLLPSGRSFRLASDLASPSPVDARTLYATVPNGGTASCNGGGAFFSVGGHFALTGRADILLGVLPPVVHLRTESDRAALRWSLERMRDELREPQPGGALVLQQLASMLLVQALRLYLADGGRGGVGWLSALADAQIGAALRAVHGDPAHRWTLQAMAAHAGLSRSGFALRFRELVGEPPVEYLTRWRMLLAGDRLAHSGDPVSVVARSLGYGSESAFSTAFKRVMGCSPRHYGRGGHLPSSASGDATADRANRIAQVAA